MRLSKAISEFIRSIFVLKVCYIIRNTNIGVEIGINLLMAQIRMVIGYRLLVLSRLMFFKPAKQARSNLVVKNCW
jgi:hypothetical protein